MYAIFFSSFLLIVKSWSLGLAYLLNNMLICDRFWFQLKSQVTSSDPNELECFEKQDISDDTKQSGIFQAETDHLCEYTPKLVL